MRQTTRFGCAVAISVALLVLNGCKSGEPKTDGPAPPVAEAGPAQNVSSGTVVNLDGGGSSSPSGAALNYSWSFTSIPNTSTAVLSSTTVSRPTFTADKIGTYVLSLKVDDGTLNSAPDTVTVTAQRFGASFTMPDTRQVVTYTTTTGEDADYSINLPTYTDNGDYTITDNVTSLVWQKVDNGVRTTYAEADTYCANLTLGGKTDWRLPTRLELVSLLVDNGSGNAQFDTTYFSAWPISNFFFWTSTPFVQENDYVWSVDFHDGRCIGSIKADFRTYLTRCVRSGP